MLHFLIGAAICIWIAERVTHYWREWRWRRQQRRYVAWLRQGIDEAKAAQLRMAQLRMLSRTEVVAPLPQQLPQPEPEPERRSDTYVTVGLCVAFAAVMLLIGFHH